MPAADPRRSASEATSTIAKGSRCRCRWRPRACLLERAAPRSRGRFLILPRRRLRRLIGESSGGGLGDIVDSSCSRSWCSQETAPDAWQIGSSVLDTSVESRRTRLPPRPWPTWAGGWARRRSRGVRRRMPRGSGCATRRRGMGGYWCCLHSAAAPARLPVGVWTSRHRSTSSEPLAAWSRRCSRINAQLNCSASITMEPSLRPTAARAGIDQGMARAGPFAGVWR